MGHRKSHWSCRFIIDAWQAPKYASEACAMSETSAEKLVLPVFSMDYQSWRRSNLNIKDAAVMTQLF